MNNLGERNNIYTPNYNNQDTYRGTPRLVRKLVSPHITSSIYDVFLSLKTVCILANTIDPDETPPSGSLLFAKFT